MFTGIVEATGEVVDVADEEGGRRLRVAADLDGLARGQSINVSGACLTVEEFGDLDGSPWFSVFLAEETVAKTYLGDVGVGDAVNVERALRADGRFDGHIVQGHVDTVATVSAVEPVGEDWRFTFTLPGGYGRYVVDKGSVALDGVSLTVADRRPDEFDVAVIPTTYELTTLSGKDPGDPVHLEVDVVAKYVEKMVEGYR